MNLLLAGSWLLRSWEIHGPGTDAVAQPFGPEPSGLLVYTPDGWMSATVCRPDRMPFPAGGSPRRLDDTTVAAAFRSYFHYAGPYRIEADSVIHSVRYSLNPSMVGTEQVRSLTLDGDRLILRGEEAVSGSLRRHQLVWRRAGARGNPA